MNISTKIQLPKLSGDIVEHAVIKVCILLLNPNIFSLVENDTFLDKRTTRELIDSGLEAADQGISMNPEDANCHVVSLEVS